MTPREFLEIKSLLTDILNKVTALADAAQKELLTPAEVRKMFQMSRDTYRRYVDNGIFKQVRPDKERNGKVYIRRSDIQELIHGGKL